MLWVLLFESFDLCDEKLPVRKKGLLTFRSVERVVAAITFGANPAGVTADARSARIGKYSVTVVRGMEYHPLLLPDTHIGWGKVVQDNNAIIDERGCFPYHPPAHVHFS